MNQRLEQNVYHENININLIVQSVIQIKNEIKNFAHVSSKVLGTITCVQKDYVQNPSTCASLIDQYVESIIGDSLITCAEIIDMKKTIPKNLINKGNPSNRKVLNFSSCFFFYQLPYYYQHMLALTITS